MDEQLVLNGIAFVWNRAKAEANLRNHSIAFEQTAEAFFDPFLCVVDAGAEYESRVAIIGMDERWHLLFVVHVAFEDESIRLISTRKATRAERRLYED